ncbi:hypothetical protein AAG570_005879 [Ranatra chinensis]|uniref:Uncharacterized protein n=1 Tax=Ranatra chinensis TaxID=642074 RepID=A0ABD0YI64_9HEMI
MAHGKLAELDLATGGCSREFVRFSREGNDAEGNCAKCGARLKEVKVVARKTLMAEVKLMGRCHPEAFGGVQLERMFTEGFLRGTKVDNFTPVQRRRLESILQ